MRLMKNKTRPVKSITRNNNPGYKKNCNHKMSENEAVNIWTDKYIEFKRCIKHCGHWRRKVIYFDTDQELDDTMRKYQTNPNY